MTSLLLSFILFVVCIGTINGQSCFFCNDCPMPFYRDYRVSVRSSSTGFCAKKSYSSYPGAVASRGPAEYGLCRTSGSYSTIDPVTGRTMYVWCCRSNYCNTGSFTSKSTITVLLGALALLTINRCI